MNRRFPVWRLVFILLLLAGVSLWMGLTPASVTAGDRIHWGWVILSLLLHFGTCWLGSRGWLLILRSSDQSIDVKTHLQNFWNSAALNPFGGFWVSTFGRFWWSRKSSVTDRTLMTLLVWEKAAIVFSAVCAIGMLYAADHWPPQASTRWVLGVLALVVLSSAGVAACVRTISVQSRTAAWIQEAAVYGLALPTCMSLSLVSLAHGLGVVDPPALVHTSLAYVLGWFLGQLAIVVPQGLGVREYFFVRFMPHAALPWLIGFAVWERALSAIAQMSPNLFRWMRLPEASTNGLPSYSTLFPDDGIFDAEIRQRKARRIVKILEDALVPPLSQCTCVDIGCGVGHMTYILAGHFKETIGVDPDPQMIEQARGFKTAGPAPSFIIAQAEKLPFDDQSIDVVVCNQVYEHVEDPRALLAEIARVLRPNGLCYFAAHNRLHILDGHYPIPTLAWWPQPLMDAVFRFFGQSHGYPVRLMTYWGLRNLTARFERQDYTISVIKEPERWGAEQDVPAHWLTRRIPTGLFTALYPLLPGYLWVLRRRESA